MKTEKLLSLVSSFNLAADSQDNSKEKATAAAQKITAELFTLAGGLTALTFESLSAVIAGDGAPLALAMAAVTGSTPDAIRSRRKRILADIRENLPPNVAGGIEAEKTGSDSLRYRLLTVEQGQEKEQAAASKKAEKEQAAASELRAQIEEEVRARVGDARSISSLSQSETLGVARNLAEHAAAIGITAAVFLTAIAGAFPQAGTLADAITATLPPVAPTAEQLANLEQQHGKKTNKKRAA